MFYSLYIKRIEKETPESVSVEFDVPTGLYNEFSFEAGQFLTLKKEINGEDICRSYSLYSTPKSGQFKIVIKQIYNGKFSTFANNKLKVGDQIEVSPPKGNFFIEPNQNNNKSYTLIAAGSGITPIFSILNTILIEEPNSRINLFYGNKSPESTIFKEAIENLNTKYSEQLNVHFIYSQTKGESRFHSGKLEKQKLKKLFKNYAPANLTDEVFICGPKEIIINTNNLLEKKFNFDPKNIHYELFTANSTLTKKHTKKIKRISLVIAILDGETIEFNVKKGESILEAGLAAGHDIPFSCQGGVCGICKCTNGDGEVEMENNIALSDDEVENGEILSCQAKVLSPSIKINFDK